LKRQLCPRWDAGYIRAELCHFQLLFGIHRKITFAVWAFFSFIILFMSNKNATALPLLITPPVRTLPEFVDWYKSNNDHLQQQLLLHGALLVRGLPIDSVEKFEEATGGIASKFLDYVDGNSPRTRLSGGVYTSTEYDSSSFITLHNELSYSARFPDKIFFCCIYPATTGGETPLADCRKVVQRMDPSLVDAIEKKGICYVRNLHSGVGVGPSWQETYETDNREVVASYFRDPNTELIWMPNDNLRVVQHRKGIISHPVTGEKVWFNQIDQFHPVHLKQEVYEALMGIYEDDMHSLPMYVTLGDGSIITPETVHHIRATVDSETMLFTWQPGDLLIVDNILVSHGRNPFTGKRRILVSMS
jgi:alpha-ketoglutarate-dependent taurine dioxygenase